MYKYLLILMVTFISIVSTAAETSDYNQFDVYFCNINELLAKKNGSPTPKETIYFQERLKNVVETVFKSNDFKSNLKTNCLLDKDSRAAVSDKPYLNIRSTKYPSIDFDFYRIEISITNEHLIEGLPIQFDVDESSYQSQLRLAQNTLGEVEFIDPPQIDDSEASKDLALGSRSQSKQVFFEMKLAFAGALMSGRSAWPVADKNVEQILMLHKEHEDAPYSYDRLNLISSEQTTYYSYNYLSRRYRGLSTDKEVIQYLNEKNPLSPTPRHILLYENIMSSERPWTRKEFRSLVEDSKLHENGFKLRSPFENLVIDVAGFER